MLSLTSIIFNAVIRIEDKVDVIQSALNTQRNMLNPDQSLERINLKTKNEILPQIKLNADSSHNQKDDDLSRASEEMSEGDHLPDDHQSTPGKRQTGLGNSGSTKKGTNFAGLKANEPSSPATKVVISKNPTISSGVKLNVDKDMSSKQDESSKSKASIKLSIYHHLNIN